MAAASSNPVEGALADDFWPGRELALRKSTYVLANRANAWERAWLGDLERERLLDPAATFSVVYCEDWDNWNDETGPIGAGSGPSVLEMVGNVLTRDSIKPADVSFSGEQTKLKCWWSDVKEVFTVFHAPGCVVRVNIGRNGERDGSEPASDVTWDSLSGVLTFKQYVRPSQQGPCAEYTINFRNAPRPVMHLRDLSEDQSCHNTEWGWVTPFESEWMCN
jgi:hypothetical protein